jgi:hypothetical protein
MEFNDISGRVKEISARSYYRNRITNLTVIHVTIQISKFFEID